MNIWHDRILPIIVIASAIVGGEGCSRDITLGVGDHDARVAVVDAGPAVVDAGPAVVDAGPPLGDAGEIYSFPPELTHIQITAERTPRDSYRVGSNVKLNIRLVALAEGDLLPGVPGNPAIPIVYRDPEFLEPSGAFGPCEVYSPDATTMGFESDGPVASVTYIAYPGLRVEARFGSDAFQPLSLTEGRYFGDGPNYYYTFSTVYSEDSTSPSLTADVRLVTAEGTIERRIDLSRVPVVSPIFSVDSPGIPMRAATFSTPGVAHVSWDASALTPGSYVILSWGAARRPGDGRPDYLCLEAGSVGQIEFPDAIARSYGLLTDGRTILHFLTYEWSEEALSPDVDLVIHTIRGLKAERVEGLLP